MDILSVHDFYSYIKCMLNIYSLFSSHGTQHVCSTKHRKRGSQPAFQLNFGIYFLFTIMTRSVFHFFWTAAATFSNPVDSLSNMAPSIKLTYFDIEAAAEPVRLALVLSGTEFEDERINFANWPTLKASTPYGQVPLMSIDGAPVRTQSEAMLRWVGSTLSTNLYPADKLFDIEEALGVVGDMSKSFEPCLYVSMRPERFGHAEGFSKTEEGQKVVKALRQKWIDEELAKYLTFLTDMIDKNGGVFLACTEPTIADCKAIPFLRSLTRGHLDHIPVDCLEVNPKIVEYVKRFCALEPIVGRYKDGMF